MRLSDFKKVEEAICLLGQLTGLIDSLKRADCTSVKLAAVISLTTDDVQLIFDEDFRKALTLFFTHFVEVVNQRLRDLGVET